MSDLTDGLLLHPNGCLGAFNAVSGLSVTPWIMKLSRYVPVLPVIMEEPNNVFWPSGYVMPCMEEA